MNNIIQKIIELDQSARERVDMAQLQARQITEECMEERERLTAEADAQISAQIERITSELRKKADGEIELLRAQSERKCLKLSETAKHSAEKWQSEILERIFGG